MKLRLQKKYKELGEIHSFIFEPAEQLQWQAGQYINLTMPDVPPVQADRLFTIASAPYEKSILITTLIGPSPFKQRLASLQLGDEIEADQVGGDFIWQDDGRSKLYVAGGIGATTFRSIVLDRTHKGLPNEAILLYAGKPERRPFVDEFLAVAAKDGTFSVKDYVDERLTVKKIFDDVPGAAKRTIYLSGSQPFVETLGNGLMAQGIPRAHLKYDYFDGYETLEY